jgi:hypothetical protein
VGDEPGEHTLDRNEVRTRCGQFPIGKPSQRVVCDPDRRRAGSLLARRPCTRNKRIKTNKLTLNHETVRTLNNKQLTAVAGGTGEYFSKLSDCIFNQCVQQ